MTDHIDESVESGVHTIVLNRPSKKNAITIDMYQTLSEALRRAEVNSHVKVSVITGYGPDFSSGNDIHEFVEIAQAPEKMASIMAFLQALTAYKKPLIGAVEGWSVGVAATLLLHCDMVIAARNTQLVFPFVQLGLVPEAASSYLLPKLVGHQRAFEILMFGEPIKAQEAHDAGIVNHVCEIGESRERAFGYARRIASLPTEAVMLSKELLKCQAIDDVQMALMREGRIFKDRLRSPEAVQQFADFIKGSSSG